LLELKSFVYNALSGNGFSERGESMERRFTVRLGELMDDANVHRSVVRGLLTRLERYMEPFVQHLWRTETRQNAHHYVAGLVSNLERKNVESIAYHHDQERQPLQKFIGQAPWDHRPLLGVLTEQVAAELGEEDAVLVFDSSGFPKKGPESVAVQRQWCGRLGKVENCQIGIYLGYVSRVEHALVDMRLYLPKEWAQDKRRRRKVGVPKEVRFRTRHELALGMLDERGPSLPHAWIAGDDEMGRSTRFRQALRQRQERYLLAVPCNTLVRDLEAPAPPYTGRGIRPRAPFGRVDRWAAALPTEAWTSIEVRDGEKGPLQVQTAKTRVLAMTERCRPDHEEVLVVFREQQADGTWKHDYCLSNASPETELAEFARVLKAEHRIEDCLQRAKGEAGLAHYEVRTWLGWHHHQTLSLLATWFLTREARRGKKMDAGDYSIADSLGHCLVLACCSGMPSPRTHSPYHDSPPPAPGTGALLSLEKT
jgi:SRSO17 transposase